MRIISAFKPPDTIAEKFSGGNVTLHPMVAPQRYDDLESIAASIRNAAHC